MEEKDYEINPIEENKEEEKIVEEESDVLEEEIETNNNPLSEYEVKLNEYEYKLEEALVNIEAKENAALASESEEDLLAYQKAKEDYAILRKEYKTYKKENAPRTWWNTLPLRVKIFSLATLIFCFPGLSWGIIILWYYPYKWFYSIFEKGLNKMFSNGNEVITYILLGFMWYLVTFILIGWGSFIFSKRNKEDVLPDYKKTYVGFVIGNAVLIFALLVYQVITMVVMWF